MTTGVGTSQASPTPRPYDGETIFRGIVLGDGPVAKLFPEIWDSPELAPYLERAEQQASAKELAAAKQKIVDMLRAQDPTFFNRFGAEMQSGDHIRIQQALTEVGTRLQKEMESSASADASKPQIYNAVYAVTYYAAAAVVAVALYAAVVVVVIAWRGPGSSNLQRDVYVDLVAQRLVPQTGRTAN